MSEYEVVWPLGRQAATPTTGAATGTAPDLDHATVAFLWNYTRKGDQMFRIIKEALRREHPHIAFVDYDAFGDIHGASEAAVVAVLPERLRAHKVDYTIVGISG